MLTVMCKVNFLVIYKIKYGLIPYMYNFKANVINVEEKYVLQQGTYSHSSLTVAFFITVTTETVE